MKINIKDCLKTIAKDKKTVATIIAFVLVLTALSVTISLFVTMRPATQNIPVDESQSVEENDSSETESSKETDNETETAQTIPALDSSEETAPDTLSPESSEETAKDTIPQKVSAEPKVETAPPVPAQTTHVHYYMHKVIKPTCTQQGYTFHTCSCGATYTDSYVNAEHDFLKSYVCRRCGIPSPEDARTGLAIWMQNNAPETPKGTAHILEYSDDTGVYTLYSDDNSLQVGSVAFMLIYECGDFGLTIYLHGYTDDCGIRAYDGGKGDDENVPYLKWRSSADTDLKLIGLTPGMSLNFDSYYQGTDTTVTLDSLTEKAEKYLPVLLTVIRDKLLTPNTGLTLADLGITSFGG